MAPRQTSYAASGMTARAKGDVIAGSMYWLTSRTRRSTSRSPWPVSCARRLASRPGSASCSRATLDTHLESIGSSLPPGRRSASSTTLPPTQTLRCSISGGRWRRASSRMCSPAAPRLELPAMTLSRRLRLARASSSTGCRAEMAERRPSTTDWVWLSRSRSSAACDSWVWPPAWRRGLGSATSRACPSALLDRFHTRKPTTPIPTMRHTRSSANNSSSTDILRIVAADQGINKPINMTLMAEVPPPAGRRPGAGPNPSGGGLHAYGRGVGQALDLRPPTGGNGDRHARPDPGPGYRLQRQRSRSAQPVRLDHARVLRLPAQRAERFDQGGRAAARKGDVRQRIAVRDVRQDGHQRQRRPRPLPRGGPRPPGARRATPGRGGSHPLQPLARPLALTF